MAMFVSEIIVASKTMMQQLSWPRRVAFTGVSPEMQRGM